MHPGAADEAGQAGFRLPRQARITTAAEIRTLLRRGKRRKTRHLDVFFAGSPVSYPRLGVVVPKHRHNAVQRNRLKRRLRELGRTLLLPRLREAERPLDVLLRTRAEAYDASWDELRQQLQRWLEEEVP